MRDRGAGLREIGDKKEIELRHTERGETERQRNMKREEGREGGKGGQTDKKTKDAERRIDRGGEEERERGRETWLKT